MLLDSKLSIPPKPQNAVHPPPPINFGYATVHVYMPQLGAPESPKSELGQVISPVAAELS